MSTKNEKEAAYYLAAHFPKIKSEIYTLSAKQNFAGVMQAVVNYLRQLSEASETKAMSRAIKFVGWVFRRGNPYIKDIISNLFVRSLDGILRRTGAEGSILIFQKLPTAFKRIYQQQHENILLKSK